MAGKRRKKISYESLTPDQREILYKYSLLRHANPSKAENFIEWMKAVLAWKKGRGRKPANVRFDVIQGGKKMNEL